MTVSKTTTQEKARRFLIDHASTTGMETWAPVLAGFADCISQEVTAELQKENARLREALEKIMGCVGTSTESWHIAGAALNPPKGGAVPEGLSKEKAK